MNKHDEKVVAAYMAGEKEGEALLQACRERPELLQRVADLTVVDRLLGMPVTEGEARLFVEEVREKLGTMDADVFASGVRSRLEKEHRRSVRCLPALAAAAAVVVLMGLGAFLRPAPGLATVVSVTDSAGPQVGETLEKGTIVLTRGYSEIVLNNGVVLLLEAPIALDLEAVDQVRVHHGRLVTRVPEAAIGFRVLTPGAEVVDLGTEFGIAVADNGASEVHVLEGEVKARGLGEKAFSYLVKDEGMAFDENQQPHHILSNPDSFLRALPGRSAEDPNFLHWSCDRVGGGGALACAGTGVDGAFYPGVLKSVNGEAGPRFEDGPFGDALYFNGEDAYVQTDFPGIGGHHPRTVAFWAKVPKDFSIHTGYGMISWGLMEPGSAWQISPNPTEAEGPLGRLRVGTATAPVIGSTDLRDNRWHHLAVVMYGGNQADVSTHILLYVDGKLERTKAKAVCRIRTALDAPGSIPLMFGRNIAFTESRPKSRGHFFRGWLDEIYVFDTALNQEDILQLMRTNRFQPDGIAQR